MIKLLLLATAVVFAAPSARAASAWTYQGPAVVAYTTPENCWWFMIPNRSGNLTLLAVDPKNDEAPLMWQRVEASHKSGSVLCVQVQSEDSVCLPENPDEWIATRIEDAGADGQCE